MPTQFNVEQARKQAKDLIRSLRQRNEQAAERFCNAISQLGSHEEAFDAKLALHDAQRVIAREHGFESWQQLLEGINNPQFFVEPDHPFVVAVRNLDFSQVRQQLESNPSLADARVRGDTTLTGTIWEEGKRVSVDENESRSATAIHFAAMNGHSDLAILLIELGAGINELGYDENKDATSAVVLATWEGDLATLRVLLEAGADANINLPIESALYTALEHGAQRKADLLIDHGAQLDLFTAAVLGDVPTVKRLLDDEPDTIDHRHPKRNRTPLEEAINKGKLEVADLLVARGANVPPEAYAALGNINELKRILAADANSIHDLYGTQRLLTWALLSRQLETIQFLLDAGANPEGVDQWGVTPLRAVAQVHDVAGATAVRMLVEAGANPGLESRGFTPLAAAIDSGNLFVAGELIQQGASVNQTSHGRRTPLHFAITENHHQAAACIELLLDAGADPTQTDDANETPYDTAIRLGLKDLADAIAGRA